MLLWRDGSSVSIITLIALPRGMKEGEYLNTPIRTPHPNDKPHHLPIRFNGDNRKTHNSQIAPSSTHRTLRLFHHPQLSFTLIPNPPHKELLHASTTKQPPSTARPAQVMYTRRMSFENAHAADLPNGCIQRRKPDNCVLCPCCEDLLIR